LTDIKQNAVIWILIWSCVPTNYFSAHDPHIC